MYLDHKYLNLLSWRLRNFKRKSSNLYIFSCPECGDSQKKARAAHCYAFETEDGLRLYCHRCGWSHPFYLFLKNFDHDMYAEYLLEKFGEREKPVRTDWGRMEELASASTPAFREVPDWQPGLLRCSEITEPEHPAIELLVKRRIPLDRYQDLWHCDDFRAWGSRLAPEKFERTRTEPRLVIPFVSETGGLVGFQGRSYDPDAAVRYITVSLETDEPFLFGMDRVDRSRPVVACEGPIDSMFVNNGVASGGGVITRELARAGLKDATILYDNEPRSTTTVQKMERAVDRGYRIFVWPESVLDKDLNDWYRSMVEAGVASPSTFVMRTVNERSFTDLEAELEINAWRKC